MSLKFKAATNTIVQIISKLIVLFISVIITIYLTRYLGPEGYGKYTFVFVYITFFLMLGDFGLNNILIREISKEKNNIDILMGNALIIKFLFSIVTILLSIGIIYLLNYSVDTRIGVIIASITILFSAIETLKILFQIYLKMEYQAGIDVLTKAIFLFLVLVAIFYKRGLFFIIGSFVLSSALGLIFIIFFSFKFLKPKFKIDYSLCIKLLKETLPMGISLMLTIIYWRIDTIMLSLMQGDKAVGLYNLSYRFIDLLILLVPGTIMVSIFPIMSEQFKNDKDSLKATFQKTFDIMVIISVFFILVIMLSAENIIYLLGGEKFRESTPALQILIFGAAFIFIANIYGYLLISAGKQKLNLLIDLIGTILNISLNLYLIPKFSFIGASIATLITQAIVLITGILFVLKFLHIKTNFQIINKIIAISILICLEIFALRRLNCNPVIIIILNSLTYLILILLFKCIFFAELYQVFKESLNKFGLKSIFTNKN
ncbi:MAG: hypothetical protein A2042_07455 [Candidatus Schekmanbacteria bacterium GWA2_38_11]|uniref:Uncharacterized protein n=1 Tax=Candidatus Schekmanbacteria bacterium GWA2_38_11 TaxID=1817876 RepID=A0A1F7RR79_9BACT|nr:MAG: hypothetical protein A2042_07455 [Candidatus Schekmanbacteria bacterium GWA2_38_11]